MGIVRLAAKRHTPRFWRHFFSGLGEGISVDEETGVSSPPLLGDIQWREVKKESTGVSKASRSGP